MNLPSSLETLLEATVLNTYLLGQVLLEKQHALARPVREVGASLIQCHDYYWNTRASSDSDFR